MSTKKEIVDFRRRLVAGLVLRHSTQREIVETLAQSGQINPRTKRPWSLGTINSDIKALREAWREESQQDIKSHVAELRAELREVRRLAWSQKDLANVLRAIKQEADLLGANATERLDITSAGQPISEIERWKEVRRRNAEQISEIEGE